MLRVLIPRGRRASITARTRLRSQEREREGVRHVAFGAALTISDLVDRRSAENLIQPSAPKRDRAQQHGSGFRLDAAVVTCRCPGLPGSRVCRAEVAATMRSRSGLLGLRSDA